MKKLLIGLLLATSTFANHNFTTLDLIMITTLTPFLTTSDAVESKVEEIKTEASSILALIEDQNEVVISQDLMRVIEEIKVSNKELEKATNIEILEAIILAE